jgi:hypothetical protein
MIREHSIKISHVSTFILKEDVMWLESMMCIQTGGTMNIGRGTEHGLEIEDQYLKLNRSRTGRGK